MGVSPLVSYYPLSDSWRQAAHRPSFVVIPGVYGSWLDYMEPGPGAGSSKWLNDYVDTSTGDRVIRFEYDSKSLFSGSKCREAIRSCAMQLLRGLTSVRKSATRVCRAPATAASAYCY